MTVGADGEENGTAEGNASDQDNKYSITDTTTLFAPTDDELYCFDLWVCPDSMPYLEGVKQRAQFYFGLTANPHFHGKVYLKEKTAISPYLQPANMAGY